MAYCHHPLPPRHKTYRNWKEKFVRVRGRDYASMITAGVNGTPRFPLSWKRDLKIIIGFDFEYLTLVEKYVVYVLNDSEFMHSYAMITID